MQESFLERLYFKETKEEGVRFSWWKGNMMIPRPLDATESQLLQLMNNALHEGVFSNVFITSLKNYLNELP